MTASKKTAKTAKTAAAKTAPAAVAAPVNASAAVAVSEAFAAIAQVHIDKLALLAAVDCSTMSEHDSKAHKGAMLAEKNRADRNADMAKSMLNDKFAAAFLQFSLTVASVNRLQIYAQDKLIATLSAIAADCALSSIRAGNHANMMTQRLVAALDADGELTISNAPRRMHDMNSDKSMGTYSAQASSSRQVLETLGMVSFDVLTKAFKLSERGETYRHVIAC